MSLSTSDRPAVIQAIGAVVARHMGEGVEMPVTVPKEVETRIKRLLFKLPRRRVIFLDDLQEVRVGCKCTFEHILLEYSCHAHGSDSGFSFSLKGKQNQVANAVCPLSRSSRSAVVIVVVICQTT